MKYFLLSICVLFTFAAKAQEKVELVISAGMVYSASTSFSKSGKYVANFAYKRVHIWDVKTGRQIREASVTTNDSHTLDTVWFSDDDKHLFVGLMMSNDKYEVDVVTGESVFIKSDVVYDYTQPFHQSVMMKGSTHMQSKSKKDLIFKSPDNKHELRMRKIKNPYDDLNIVPFMYTSVVKSGAKETLANDTVYTVDIAFSNDSKLVYSNKKIYNLKTHKLVSELQVAPYAPLGIGFLPGTHIPVTGAKDHIRIWDFPTIRTIPLKGLSSFKYAPGYGFAIADIYDPTSQKKKQARIDFRQEKVLNRITSSASKIAYLSTVGVDAKTYCLNDFEKKNPSSYEMKFFGYMMDGESGKMIKKVKNTATMLHTSTPNVIIIDSASSKKQLYDINKGVIGDFPVDKEAIFSFVYLVSNSKKYAMGNLYGTPLPNPDLDQIQVAAWETSTGKRVFSEWVDGGSFLAYEISPDESMFAMAENSGDILIYNFKSGEKMMTLKGHTNSAMELAFSDDGNRLISSSYDGSRKVWNLQTEKEMVSLVSIGDVDYAIVTPDQYYYTTKGANSNIHFVKGMEIYPFAQFDLKYNRPDIILQRMLADNQEMVRPYNLAYLKRLKRLGFSEDMLSGEFHMPEVEITNSESFPITTSSQAIELAVRGIDSKYKLDRILVRVNGVPIHGKLGLSVKGKGVKSIGQKIKLNLATGSNAISVAVMNEKGVESLTDNFTIQYIPGKKKLPNLHLFTIGVSKYKSEDFNLSYASKDASDLAALYSGEHAPFKEVFSHHLVDGDVTGASVSQLKEALKATNVDDVVCVFFAGHGLLDGDLNYFLAAHDVNFEDPVDGGIPYESLEDLLDGIPARKKLMLLDACHSGEIDKDEVAIVENTTQPDDVTFRAVGSSGLKQVGLNNSFELMKELFSDIRKSSGTMIISSAGGTEYAMEGDQWNNGVFTYCLLNGLKNGDADLNNDHIIMMSEVNQYVRLKVTELTQGRQQPTNRVEVFELDFRLW